MIDTGAMRADIEQALSRIPIDFGGGCSVEKAAVMAGLITAHGLDTALESGVYRGRSFIPLALAMRAQSRGRAFGVDPTLSSPPCSMTITPPREGSFRPSLATPTGTASG